MDGWMNGWVWIIKKRVFISKASNDKEKTCVGLYVTASTSEGGARTRERREMPLDILAA